MIRNRPAIFRGRHFEPEIIATCVRWYLRFSLSLRNVEEIMAERGLMVDHTTVWRWCQRYGPVIYHRLRGKLKYTTTTWHMDETYVRIAGRWGVFVPCSGQSRRHGGTSICRKPEIVKRPRYFSRRLYRIRTIELHACCAWTGAASTRQRFEICGPKAYRCGVDEGPNDTPTIELNRTTDMSSEGSVPCRDLEAYVRRSDSFRVSKLYRCSEKVRSLERSERT